VAAITTPLSWAGTNESVFPRGLANKRILAVFEVEDYREISLLFGVNTFWLDLKTERVNLNAASKNDTELQKR